MFSCPGGSPKKVGAFGNTRAPAFLNAPTDAFPVFLEQLVRWGTHQLARWGTHQLWSSCVPKHTNCTATGVDIINFFTVFPGTHQLFWNRPNAPVRAFPNTPTFVKSPPRAFPPKFPKVGAFPNAPARVFPSKLNAPTFLGEPPGGQAPKKSVSSRDVEK